jgi:hypothetical protein
MRFLSGRRFSIGIVVLTSLALLTLTVAIADTPTSVVDRGQEGLSLQSKTEDSPSRTRATFARSNYLWPFTTGPNYGQVDRSLLRKAGTLYTPVGSFRPAEGGFGLLPQPLQTLNRLDEAGLQYFIVQLDPQDAAQGSQASLIDAIEANGGTVVKTMPVMAVVARLTPSAYAAVQSISGILSVSPYHAGLKLDPAIGRTPHVSPFKALSDVYDLDISVFKGEDSRLVAEAVAQAGGTVSAIWPDTVRAEIHRSKLAGLAAIEGVELIGEHMPMLPHGEETTSAMQSGGMKARPAAKPYHDAGIDGTGVVVMILDSGIQLDAGDMSHTSTCAGLAGASGNDAACGTTGHDAHRKVVRYQSTNTFGGIGDSLGCDAPAQGGFTHGAVVASTALGNATNVPAWYGTPYQAPDQNQPPQFWALDGVAKGARVVMFDGQQTPAAVSCADPLQDTISPGDLYSGGATGSLGDAYTNNGARIVNFSWGSDSNTYSANAIDIDNFIFEKKNAMVFVSAGNAGQDADNNDVPDSGSLGTPGTTKMGLAIGSSLGNDYSGAILEFRSGFSSTGPAPSGRIAPQLMAPGSSGGGVGLASEFSCRSNDNDQNSPVECDINQGSAGTSFASPAAAGAGALVIDFFDEGFYPDGVAGGVLYPNVSGALIKAALVASADFMTGGTACSNTTSVNLHECERPNNEQGWGRIQLDKALRLDSWPASPSGMLAVDGARAGGLPGLSGLSGSFNCVTNPAPQSATFTVNDDTQELRVALAWLEGAGSALINDLDLELVAPSGKTYRGNYSTDDLDNNGTVTGSEDCPPVKAPGVPDGLDNASQWNLPVCPNSVWDGANPIEAIYLSPDYSGDGSATACAIPNNPACSDLNTADDNQIELGLWTVSVGGMGSVGSCGTSTGVEYALVIAGGVANGSSVRYDSGSYVCNETATITVNETADGGDGSCPNAGSCSASTIESRTTVNVRNSLGAIVDTESSSTGLNFTQTPGALNFVSDPLQLTDGTERDPGNGVLDVRSGDTLEVSYVDVGGTRTSKASVNCTVAITSGAITFGGFGQIVFNQFGQDASVLVQGGCERNIRGNFEFGFPDRYMDAGESIFYNFAFGSSELADMQNVEVSLRCVNVNDALAPADCRGGSTDCLNPDRLISGACEPGNGGSGCHTECGSGIMTILDSPQVIGLLPSGSAISSNFAIQMAPSITGQPDVEMVLEVTARTSGLSAKGVAVNRHKVDVDEATVFYSTDFPTGGSQTWDRNNNELVENPTSNIGDFTEDYRFETRTYGDLTAGGTKNLALMSPWNFDNNNGGFQSGIGSVTDESSIIDTIAQWGEDKNFNGVNDRRCTGNQSQSCIKTTLDCSPFGWGTCNSIEDRDPVDNNLNQNWSTAGGCGWQTKAPGTCSNNVARGCYTTADCVNPGTCTGAAQATGGVWHTGRIGATTGACLVNGATPGQCQTFETVSGSTGQLTWFELLETPEMQKVGDDTATIEITEWSWNQLVNMPDSNVFWTWEFDTDLATLNPSDLRADLGLLNFGAGAYGAVANSGNPSLTNGYSIFAQPSGSGSFNGTVGNNRVGKNSCYFNTISGGLELALALPKDDDINNGYCSDNHNVKCTATANCTAAGWVGPCLFANGTVDEYVTANGPLRNMDMTAFNGPDMRFSTLEDIYGDTGDSFKAAIGMINFEKAAAADPDPAPGFGLSVDDVLVEWKEFTLAADNSNCASGGACASMDMSTGNFFEGNALIRITVVDPYGISAANDCDGNGDNTSGGDDNDCDNNGTRDIRLRVFSAVEPVGEFFIVNETAPGSGIFVKEVPVSVSYNVPGVVFISQQGTTSPIVTAETFDWDDGTGAICQNALDPAARGLVRDQTTVFLTTGTVTVVNTLLTDNGDNDGWADTNETVSMQISVSNKTGVDLTNVVARLATNDPNIDCVINAFAVVGDIADGATEFSSGSFQFKVANVDRTTLALTTLDDLSADFEIVLSADQIDAATSPQAVTLDLDLNVAGGGTPTSFFEGFEVASGLSQFTTMNLDFGSTGVVATNGAHPLANSQCQYSDPDWVQSNSYGTPSALTCTPGSSPAFADAYYFQVHQTSAVDGGRAYSGTRSLYWGIFGPNADEHTTALSTLEAIRTTNPIALGYNGVPPELTMKHMISLMDWRTVNAPQGEAADRGVVAVQFATTGGTGVGNWLKLIPYQNLYESQGTDNYTNCLFDPVDDGNTKADFFDASDPLRRLGPSSTCMPEFSFAYSGDTFNAFSADGLGQATDGPGLQGALGIGTWVESKFNLERFRGRNLRLRMLVTGLDNGASSTYQATFMHNPDPGDDGWWIDDVAISNTLTSPATLSNDDTNNSGLPGCGPTCGSVTAALVATPSGTLAAPGQVVSLSAVTSSATSCLNGVLQYRFSDGGGLLRDWTDNPDFVAAPGNSTTYTVAVRCSSDPACADSTNLLVPVNCPSSGNLGINMLGLNPTTMDTGNGGSIDIARGSATSGPGINFAGAAVNTQAGPTFSTAANNPAAGTFFWYTARTAGGGGPSSFCNAGGGSYNSPGSVDRDALIP